MVIRKMYTPNRVLKSKAKFDKYSEVWWSRCAILVLGKLRLKDNHKFKASLGYSVRPYLKRLTKTNLTDTQEDTGTSGIAGGYLRECLAFLEIS